MVYFIVYNNKSFLGNAKSLPIIQALNKENPTSVNLFVTTVTPEAADATLLQLISFFRDICQAPENVESMKKAEKRAFHCSIPTDKTYSVASLAKIPVRVLATNDSHLRIQAINLFLSMDLKMETVLLIPVFFPPKTGFKPLANKNNYHNPRLNQSLISRLQASAKHRVLFYPETNGQNTRWLCAEPIEKLQEWAKSQTAELKPNKDCVTQKGLIQRILENRGRRKTEPPRIKDAAIFVDGDDRVALQPFLNILLPDMVPQMQSIFDEISAAFHTTSYFVTHI